MSRDADWYWQDKLAKFFPTSKGPTNTEREMFRYGLEEGARRTAVLEEAMRNIIAETHSWVIMRDTAHIISPIMKLFRYRVETALTAYQKESEEK